MSNVPLPMTPADCNLQDFKFMPLDVARLRGSELASDETPEACWAALMLWCASWHEIPAGSIPDNNQWQAKAAGYVARGKIAKEWADVREGAMRGYITCSDGRLYHPVVAEKANDAWVSKLKQRWKTECGRIKKHNERHHTTIPYPDFDEWRAAGCLVGQPLYVPGDIPPVSPATTPACPPVVTPQTLSKRQGEGQGQGELISVPDGTGAEAPATTDPAKTASELTKAELWKAGKSLLRDQKMPEAQCGSFVGKLCKDYGDEIVIEAVRNTVVKQPADAASFLKSECQRLKGERPAGKTTTTDRRVSTLQGLADTSPTTGDSYAGNSTIDVDARVVG